MPEQAKMNQLPDVQTFDLRMLLCIRNCAHNLSCLTRYLLHSFPQESHIGSFGRPGEPGVGRADLVAVACILHPNGNALPWLP